MTHHRRTVRTPLRLEVRLVDGGRPSPALTDDLGDHGLFVRTDEHWVPNALVRLHVIDPEDPRPIALLGIVARCIPPGEAEGPGIGVSLFGNGRQVTQRWRALVRRAEAAAAGWRSELESDRTPIDAVRRATTRRQALLEVDLVSRGRPTARVDLGDVSEGGAFLRMETLPGLETSLHMHVRALNGDTIAVPVLVVRRVDSLDPHEKGIGVRVAATGAEKTAWEAFLAKHAAVHRALPAFLPNLTLAETKPE